jgi:hypothetical protein
VHETPRVAGEVKQLDQAITVDARYVTGHTLNVVSHDMSRLTSTQNQMDPFLPHNALQGGALPN